MHNSSFKVLQNKLTILNLQLSDTRNCLYKYLLKCVTFYIIINSLNKRKLDLNKCTQNRRIREFYKQIGPGGFSHLNKKTVFNIYNLSRSRGLIDRLSCLLLQIVLLIFKHLKAEHLMLVDLKITVPIRKSALDFLKIYNLASSIQIKDLSEGTSMAKTNPRNQQHLDHFKKAENSHLFYSKSTNQRITRNLTCQSDFKLWLRIKENIKLEQSIVESLLCITNKLNLVCNHKNQSYLLRSQQKTLTIQTHNLEPNLKRLI